MNRLPRASQPTHASSPLYSRSRRWRPSSVQLAAQTQKTLGTLNSSDGMFPWSLTMDANGNLYGTTYEGGSYGSGTVFEVLRLPGGSWQIEALHSFKGGWDGQGPQAGLVMDSAGNLYGTTTWGGVPCNGRSEGCGTVFKLTHLLGQTWTKTILHTFSQFSDGGQPSANLILDSAGNLYGTTSAFGNLNDCGWSRFQAITQA